MYRIVTSVFFIHLSIVFFFSCIVKCSVLKSLMLNSKKYIYICTNHTTPVQLRDDIKIRCQHELVEIECSQPMRIEIVATMYN